MTTTEETFLQRILRTRNKPVSDGGPTRAELVRAVYLLSERVRQ